MAGVWEELTHAIYQRIIVTGAAFVGVELTPAAKAHGLQALRPEEVEVEEKANWRARPGTDPSGVAAAASVPPQVSGSSRATQSAAHVDHAQCCYRFAVGAPAPSRSETMRRTSIPIRIAVAAAALFSGVALLATILGDVPLLISLAITTTMLAIALPVLISRADPARRRWLARTALVGAGAGLLATVCYDVSRAGLSQLDPSPYNPFEAVRVFGVLLVGESAAPSAVYAAGVAFHFVNGTSFGVAYTLLFARSGQTSVRRAVLMGMGWGLFLELFQLSLYPGWLDIRAYDEFVRVSFMGHLVYGATLGLAARAGLRWLLSPRHPKAGR